MKTITCYFCGSETSFLFHKTAADQKIYAIYECPNCKMWQIDPLPTQQQLDALYQAQYFEKRTDRGYDNYLSDHVRKSIEATFEKNMLDLGLFSADAGEIDRSLDIGCAAGYFVEYMHNKGAKAQGIDIASAMTRAAKERGLDIITGDFLKASFEFKYDLVTMWATIEHLRQPQLFFNRSAELLSKNGALVISTCFTGDYARRYKDRWRYLNVPEHLWYFSLPGLKLMAQKAGLQLQKSFTYGSGFTAKPGAGVFYNLQKKFHDRRAKTGHRGDMIVAMFKK